jgi:mono/diheme cytochrome c family protein
MNRRNITVLAVLVVGIGAAMVWARGGSGGSATGDASKGAMVQVIRPDTFSDDARMGVRAFNAVCAVCHGANAAGSEAGPPLVHRIYEPSHHGDHAFELAVTNGVRAHHWKFGNMPPQSGLTKADVRTIVTYVRELQRANGID